MLETILAIAGAALAFYLGWSLHSAENAYLRRYIDERIHRTHVPRNRIAKFYRSDK